MARMTGKERMLTALSGGVPDPSRSRFFVYDPVQVNRKTFLGRAFIPESIYMESVYRYV